MAPPDIRDQEKSRIIPYPVSGNDPVLEERINSDLLFSNSLRTDADEPGYGEGKVSPFSFSADDGLLERVTEAVRPMTDDATFRLTTLSYCDHWREGGGMVILASHDMDIRFWFDLRGMDKVGCSFKIPSFREPFFAEDLFAALKIPVYFHACGPHPFSENELKARYPGMNILVARLNDTGFPEELYRLGCEIGRYMPEIRSGFAPEHMRETLAAYKDVFIKRHPDYSRYYTLPGEGSTDLPQREQPGGGK
jgi:hypothetical protein